MSRRKRALSLLLAALLLTALPAVSLAAPEETPAADAARVTCTLQSTEITLGDLEEAGAPAPQQDCRARTSGFCNEYYGDQLPEASRVIYDAIRGSVLMDRPAVVTLELADLLPEAAKILPGTATVTLEDGEYHLRAALDGEAEAALQSIVTAAHMALVYDFPELSWLINTDPVIRYTGRMEPAESEEEASAALEPGESYVLEGREVEIISLTYGMDEKSVRLATTAPEDVEGADRWQYADTGDRAGLEAALAAAGAEIGPLAGKTDVEKVRAVHDWVCGHVRYADRDGGRFLGNWRGYQTVWSALVEGESVCAGYARLVKLLLDDCGVPCVIVRGQSRGEAHAWNYVMLSGSWYGLDATWADQDWGIDGRNYLKGSAVFGKDHEEKGLAAGFAFSYPVLAESDYTEDVPGADLLPGDVNLDGTVNLTDLPALAIATDETRPLTPAALRNGDLNGSGTIEMADILLLTEMLRDGGYSAGAQPGSAPAVQIRADAEDLRPGDLVSVTLSGNGAAICGRLEAAGLEPCDISSGLSDEGTFVLLPDYGTSAVTYTYRVGARTGAASVRASQICRTDGRTLQQAADASWSGQVALSRPAPQPAPQLGPVVSGCEAGLAGGRTYYAKSAGASVKYYLRSSTGKMTRVAAPGVSAGSRRYYPVLSGGNVLFPRVEDGKITCYSTFTGSMEVPVLNVVQAEVSPALTDGYQTGQVNGRTYYVKVSGAGMKFYLRSSSGKMTRVAAPGVSAGSVRYYLVNHGGTVLWPVVQDGRLLRYSTWNGGTEMPVLLPA